ncbi:hypothetical protein B0T22DRAFT_533277 [Podospora appendiculata]|uniref:Uncharacterized protein n=1 Tax=Podospora appendiculata TaxID=314037 RepID=A0AAE0XIQ7_9PEZI|nr:hypothetical protein B0T22DRAFT_533277 [Podospora appendiculata]
MAVKKSKGFKTNNKGLHHHANARGGDKLRVRTRKLVFLCDVFPKAGMIYPFFRKITNQSQRDARIASAMRIHVPRMKTRIVSSEMALVFEKATEHVLAGGRDYGTDPLKFMAELHERPGMPPWVSKMHPYDIEEHCTLTKSTNKFLHNAASTLVWGGEDSELTDWFRRGGMTSEHNGLDDPGKLDDLAGQLHFEDADNVDDTAMELDADIRHPSSTTNTGTAPLALDPFDTDYAVTAASGIKPESPVRAVNGSDVPNTDFRATMEKLHLTIRLKNSAQPLSDGVGLEEPTSNLSLGAHSTPGCADNSDVTVKEDAEEESEIEKDTEKRMKKEDVDDDEIMDV